MQKKILLPLRDHRLCAILVGLLCAALYWQTLAPTAMWYDMAEMPAAAYFLGIAHSTGYPLYLLLGKLFTFIPVGDIAYRVNLMSAVFAAMTVIAVFFVVWDLTHHHGAATLAALTLGASSTLWANATLAEGYTLNAFFTALLTYLLLTWQRTARRPPLLGAFYLLGLAMGNHHLIQFFGVAMLVYWASVSWQRQSRLPWLDLPLFALLFLVGFAINLYLPLRAAQKPVMMWADASNWSTFWRMVTIGQGSESSTNLLTASPAVLWARLQRMIRFPAYEFTMIGMSLALWGAIRLWRDNRAILSHSVVGSTLTLLLILSYGIHDIFDYFLPIYVMTAIWLGVGIKALLEQLRRWLDVHRRKGSTLFLPRVCPPIVNLLLLGLPLYLVGRDYPVLDRSQDDSSYLYANYLAGRVEKDARILADFWAWAPLAYYQALDGWRSDVWIYGTLSSLDIDWEEFIPALTAESDAVYVAAGGPIPPGLLHNAELHPVGIGVIETVTDFGVPQPWDKDLWMPLGNVYRIMARPPNLAEGSVPVSRRIEEVRFDDNLSLVGFGGPTKPERIGSTLKLSYYWVLNKPTDISYYVRVHLADSGGSLQLLRGMPIWDHSHIIGGLTPTSTWAPGVIMGERYDALIPWRVGPGRYAVKVWVFAGREGTHPVPAVGRPDHEEGLTVGYVEVLPRQGPLDVRPQSAPRQ